MSPQNLLAHRFQPPQGGHHGFQESDLSSRYFLKHLKIDISQNVESLLARLLARDITISRDDD